MGKTEGTFLNLQCDCHRVASMFIKRINLYTNFKFAAKCDSAYGYMVSPSIAWRILFSIVRTGLINQSL